MSKQVLSAWGKYRRPDDEWMPLVRHCEDAAAVAEKLWASWLPEATRSFLSQDMTPSEAHALACWLASIHDVGKLSPAFASQVPQLADRMRDAGLQMKLIVERRQDTPHSLVSHKAIDGYLQGRGWSRRAAKSYAIVAGGHHGVPPTESNIRVAADRDNYGGAEWTAARNELLDHLTRLTGAETFLDRWADCPLSPQRQVLWTAIVIMADWIASSDRFPLGPRNQSLLTAEAAWADLALPERWNAATPPPLENLFRSRFRLSAGARPNAVQRAVWDAAHSMREPGALIIEAPMGIGKTEAALAAAEVFAARFGSGGVFVALPTMATSNAMFARVLQWIDGLDSVDIASAVLAHGKAELNDDYRGLLSDFAIADIGRDSFVENAHVIAHSWLHGRKRGLLADFAVGTIDQLLFASLKARHLALRHLALANKVVIVDEVHAADAYMTQYLERTLEWLGSYHVPVILMSATLPEAHRERLLGAYESGRGWASSAGGVPAGSYPRITVSDGARRTTAAEISTQTQVTVERMNDDIAALLSRITRALADGGCAAIVCNTVGRAQMVARELDHRFPGEVVLLHSRFVARHRADIESRLVDDLGRSGDRPHRRIVVGTQVIEQSLDLDFDLMISDVAPVDLILQRLGRLHRHQRTRPAKLSVPRIVLTGVEDWSAQPPAPVRESRYVYPDLHLLRAIAVFQERNTLELPQDISEVVRIAYADEFPMPEAWKAQEQDARKRFAKQVKDLEKAADTWRIWPPAASPTLASWLAENIGEVDGPRGQAKVRDTEEGIDVILTRRVGNGVALLKQCGGDEIVTEFRPNDAIARRALGGSVRLPRSLTHPKVGDAVIEALEERMYIGWQESNWLKGELVLELDSDLRTRLLNYEIRYDGVEGLIVEKEDSE
ncbi:CRISPR-associated helicase Cas3' [Hoyosella sp. YIM 151337]|uniref:CRISPR-associated helicase Cas3' n=1 Tax=Hoyosella sp. YIM 151337 TaxID=2992742 RepID=UPI0022354442|nr:CRISPR-associated helicase Cas3' [Hoyosella sp. YIM 151337]MCW4353524.1 CRISPR-associated helicase Cas3' [Hoyosella sp. YIM 151337]